MAETANNNFLGVSTQGWKDITFEVAKGFIPFADLLSSNDKNLTGWDRFQKIALTTFSFIPTLGTPIKSLQAGLRFFNFSKKLEPAFSILKKSNWLFGRAQGVFNILGGMYAVGAGIRAGFDIANWSELSEEEKIHTLIQGGQVATGLALPNFYGKKAKENANRVTRRPNTDIDQAKAYYHEMGLFGSVNHPKLASQPTRTRTENTIELTYPSHNNSYAVKTGITNKHKLLGLKEFVFRNLIGTHDALANEDHPLALKIIRQLWHTLSNKILGINKITVNNTDLIPKGHHLHLLGTHTTFADMTIPGTLGAALDMRPATTGKRQILEHPALRPVIGPFARGKTPYFIPVWKGSSEDTSRRVADFFAHSRDHESFMLFFGPGGRTPQANVLYPPHLGAFKAVIEAKRRGLDIPLVFSTHRYTDDRRLIIDIEDVIYVRSFERDGLSDDNLAIIMQEHITRKMHEIVSRNEFFKHVSENRHQSAHTSAMAGA